MLVDFEFLTSSRSLDEPRNYLRHLYAKEDTYVCQPVPVFVYLFAAATRIFKVYYGATDFKLGHSELHSIYMLGSMFP